MKKFKKISIFSWGQIVVLLVAVLVRLIHLNGSFWLDEAAQALESIRPFADQLNIASDFQPPLYHYLVHFWMMGGTSEWWLRLTSLIPGLITIWLTMNLGKKLFNQNVGLTAGILLATSQFHVFYSQELRPYSLAAMWALLTISAFYRIIDRQKYASALFILVAVAGMYTMYVFPLILITLFVSTLIWHKSFLKQITSSLVVVALLCLPWLPSFVQQLGIGTHYAADIPLWSLIVSPPLWKMAPLVIAKFLVGRINMNLNLLDIGLVSSLVALSVFLINRSFKFKKAKEVLLWLVLPIVLALMISIKVPVLDPKRILYCLPALYLLLAAGMGKGFRSAAALIILLSVNMISLSKYAADADQQREPWRQAVTDIEQASQPTDTVLFTFSAPFAPWEWYQTKQLTTLAIKNPPQELINPTILEKKISGSDRVFVFDYLHDLTDSGQIILKDLEQIGFSEIGFAQYPGIGKVHLYQRAVPVALLEF